MRITQKGFTLVEILIVVIILGILAAIVVPQFTEASDDAKQSTMASNLQTLRSQIELYYIKEGGYPDTLCSDLVAGNYLRVFPPNPLVDVPADAATDAAYGWSYDSSTGEVTAVAEEEEEGGGAGGGGAPSKPPA